MQPNYQPAQGATKLLTCQGSRKIINLSRSQQMFSIHMVQPNYQPAKGAAILLTCPGSSQIINVLKVELN
jgi:hypothetical protein